VTDLKRVAAELVKGGSLTLSSVADGFDAFCAGDLTRKLAKDAEAGLALAAWRERGEAFAAGVASAMLLPP
jgi:transcription-repair coupling factor (superfamily II helicase)